MSEMEQARIKSTNLADMPVVNPVAALPMVAAPAIISAKSNGMIMNHTRLP